MENTQFASKSIKPKKRVQFFIVLISIWILLGLFFPIIPFYAKEGWTQGACQIATSSRCYKSRLMFLTISDVVFIINHHTLKEYFDDSGYKNSKNAEENGFLPY